MPELMCNEGKRSQFKLSHFVIVKAQVEIIDALAQVLNCKAGALPMTHLGLPLGTSNKNQSPWNPVTERVENGLLVDKRGTYQKGKMKC